MARKATGTVAWVSAKKGAVKGHYKARITLPDGTRPWIHLDPGPRSPAAERTARRTAEAYSERARRDGVVSVRQQPSKLPSATSANGETVEQYAARWLDDREGRVHSIRDDRSRMRIHVLPTLGSHDVRTFDRDDVDLDRKIEDGEIAWKTVASVWTLVTSMCADMVSAKKRVFHLRQDNPCRDVRPPERGDRKAKQYLYPSEFLQFVSCEAVPLNWRRAVAIAIYTYTRDAELRILRWSDIDHGIIDITRAYNRRKPDETKGTKSDCPRRFAVEPNLLPLLDAMRAESGDEGLVVCLSSERNMPRDLRRLLKVAGVTRAALHEFDGDEPQSHVARPSCDRSHVGGRPRRRPSQDQAALRSQDVQHHGALCPGGRGHPGGVRPTLPAAAYWVARQQSKRLEWSRVTTDRLPRPNSWAAPRTPNRCDGRAGRDVERCSSRVRRGRGQRRGCGRRVHADGHRRRRSLRTSSHPGAHHGGAGGHPVERSEDGRKRPLRLLPRRGRPDARRGRE
jgi:integrase